MATKKTGPRLTAAVQKKGRMPTSLNRYYARGFVHGLRIGMALVTRLVYHRHKNKHLPALFFMMAQVDRMVTIWEIPGPVIAKMLREFFHAAAHELPPISVPDGAPMDAQAQAHMAVLVNACIDDILNTRAFDYGTFQHDDAMPDDDDDTKTTRH